MSLALTLCMVLTLLPVSAMAVEIGDPADIGGPAGSPTDYQHVYFGYVEETTVNGSSKDGEYTDAILWRVLENSGGEMTLLAEHYPSWRIFHASDNNYRDSDIRRWLGGNTVSGDTREFLANFQTAELAAINKQLAYDSGTGVATAGVTTSTSGDYFWLPSIEEANSSAWFPDGDADRVSTQYDTTNGVYWWLRSPGDYYGYAAFVHNYGAVDPFGVDVYVGNGVRPAFKLNLSSVIFTSAASGGANAKSSATVGSGLVAATAPTGAVKLTVLDDAMHPPALSFVEASNGTNNITFNYSNAVTGTNQYVSCVLEQSGAVKYYSKLANTASGTLSIPITGVANGNYTLRIFCEQANSDNYTDFASEPTDIALSVSGGKGTVGAYTGGLLVWDDTLNRGRIVVDGTTKVALIDEFTVKRNTGDIYFGNLVEFGYLDGTGSFLLHTNYNAIKNQKGFRRDDVCIDVILPALSVDDYGTRAVYDLMTDKGITNWLTIGSGTVYVEGSGSKSSAAAPAGAMDNTVEGLEYPLSSGKYYWGVVAGTGGFDSKQEFRDTNDAHTAIFIPTGNPDIDLPDVGNLYSSIYSIRGYSGAEGDIPDVDSTVVLTRESSDILTMSGDLSWYNGVFNYDVSALEVGTHPVMKGTAVSVLAASIRFSGKKPGHVYSAQVNAGILEIFVSIISSNVTTPVQPTTKINGVDVNYTIDSNGVVLLKPTPQQLENLLKTIGENGVLRIAVSGISGMKSAIIEIDLTKLIASDKLQVFAFSVLGHEVRFPVGALESMRKLATTLRFGVAPGSIIFDLTDADGKAIDWYDYANPVTVSMPFTAPMDISTHQIVMMDKSDDTIIPRSWYADGSVYAKVSKPGIYDAKIVPLTAFSDTVGRWMAEAVSYMGARGIVEGVGGDLFDAQGVITRAHFVTMLMRALDVTDIPSTRDVPVTDYEDVPEWAKPHVITAAALGITLTDEDGSFNPDAPILRQEMFFIAYEAMGACGMLPENYTMQWVIFADWDDVEAAHADAIQNLAKLKLVNGNGDGTLNPNGQSTRSEGAQFLYNILKYDAK